MASETRETFEEKVSGALDALYDGASLLAGVPSRAEALVVSVVVEAARRYPQERPEDFRRWILGRLVRQYLEYAEAVAEPTADEGEAVVPLPSSGRPRDEAAVEGLLRHLSRLDDAAPERLGQLIRGSMGELPVRERAALWLVNVMDFTYAEAARSLGMRLGGLREALYRARRELQARLGAALQDELAGRSRPGRADGGA